MSAFFHVAGSLCPPYLCANISVGQIGTGVVLFGMTVWSRFRYGSGAVLAAAVGAGVAVAVGAAVALGSAVVATASVAAVPFGRFAPRSGCLRGLMS